MNFLVFMIALLSTAALSSGFAYEDEHNTDLARERLARDLSRQKFAFAFAKRGQEALEEKLRFARDLENAKKFAFAKRSADSSDEERARNRFARELDTPKKFAFAFAKRFAGMERDEQLARFARPSFA